MSDEGISLAERYEELAKYEKDGIKQEQFTLMKSPWEESWVLVFRAGSGVMSERSTVKREATSARDWLKLRL